MNSKPFSWDIEYLKLNRVQPVPRYESNSTFHVYINYKLTVIY